MRLKVVALLVLALVVASCGPNAQERERSREAERQRTLATSRRALAEFAKIHAAIPVELFEYDPFDAPFTAQLQRQLEGKVVAFRSGLLDIERTATNDYTLALGQALAGGTVVMLRGGEEIAARFIAQSPDASSEFLVVAEIHKVEALTLKLESCEGTNCTGVELNPNLLEREHRISGRLITMQLESQPPNQ